MDHETAIRLQAAERYVARALSESERDEFEEHFFECAECAEEVRWEQIFVANAREVFREQTQRPPPPSRSLSRAGPAAGFRSAGCGRRLPSPPLPMWRCCSWGATSSWK